MSKTEGELKMNEIGQLLINNQIIYPGTIIEVQSQDEWIEVCVECAHGTYYLIPQVDLKIGRPARMEK